MTATKKGTKRTYNVHPGIARYEWILTTMKEKTGRSFDEWLKIVEQQGPASAKERSAWLRATHGLGGNSADYIAERSVGKGVDLDRAVYLKTAEEYVEKMYSGAKTGLRPLYEALLDLGLSLGKDVRVCPCQTIVPLYRNHVFAQIKPSTKTRVDFGLALKDTKAPARLIDTGGFAKKDRITHRIEITALADIDDEVKRWVKIAYDKDA